MKIFKNRVAAGKLLAARLKNIKADLVLGIPRGGVVVAAVVAKSLKLPLDIIVTRKIGAPNQEELALGSVDPDGEIVWDNELLKQLKLKIESAILAEKIKDEINEIKRRERLYRHGRKPLNVINKTVILIDDGIATGATILAAVNYFKRYGVKVILAVPVASQEAFDKIINQADQAVVLETPPGFQTVGQFYEQFDPVTDEEVIQYLR